MRGLAHGGDLSQVSSVRECSRIPWERKETLPVPQTPLVAHLAWVFPLSCAVLVACMGLLVARPWWVRPALSEKFAFSSYPSERVCAYDPRGVSPAWSPRVPALDRLVRAAFALSRLPRPAPPRSEFEEGSRGAELADPPLCGASSGELFVVAGGRARPACAAPPLTPRVAAGRGRLGGWRWLPVPPASRFPPPCLPSRASLSRSRPRLGLSRGAGVLRVVRSVRPRVCAVVASPPFPRQRFHGRWIRGSPPPLLGAPEGPCLVGFDLALGGRLLWGNGG